MLLFLFSIYSVARRCFNYAVISLCSEAFSTVADNFLQGSYRSGKTGQVGEFVWSGQGKVLFLISHGK